MKVGEVRLAAAVLATVVLGIGMASAQQAPSKPKEREASILNGVAVPPPIELTTPLLGGPEARRTRGRFTFGDDWLRNGAAVRPDSAQHRAWAYRTEVEFTAGAGVSVGAGLSISHGSQVGEYMATATGGRALLDLTQYSFADVTGSRNWGTRWFVKKRLFGARAGTSIDGLVEAILPINGEFRPAVPGSMQPLRSRALRLGIVISY